MQPLLLTALLACTASDSDDSGGPGAGVDGPFADCPVDAPAFTTLTLTEVSLDVACQGARSPDAPTLVMLHGFPEFWMGWAPVMEQLAGEYRMIVPDQRGYNGSDKPAAVDDYTLDHLVDDVVDLIDLTEGSVVLVGHDWGGAVAWAVAARHPERVDRLVIANAPHMNVFGELLATDPDQQEAFSYVDFFVEEGSEDLLVANDFAILSGMFEGVLSEDELVAYKEAWGQERAIEGGLNWYRANFVDGLPATDEQLVVSVPTLVLWGMDDTALLPSNLDGLSDYVEDLQIQEVEGATHWIAHEVPEVVAEATRSFTN